MLKSKPEAQQQNQWCMLFHLVAETSNWQICAFVKLGSSFLPQGFSQKSPTKSCTVNWQFIPLFTGLYASKRWLLQDFFHPPCFGNPLNLCEISGVCIDGIISTLWSSTFHRSKCRTMEQGQQNTGMTFHDTDWFMTGSLFHGFLKTLI